MSDPTIPLLTMFAESLTRLNVPNSEQLLPLMYAKIFLRRAREENGRRSLAGLQSDSLRELTESFATHREVLHALLLNQVLVNNEFGILIADK